MEKAKEAAKGQTLLVKGRRGELCRLGQTGADHVRHAPAPAWQTRLEPASTGVGERSGKGFHLLRCSQSYSWTLQTDRREPTNFLRAKERSQCSWQLFQERRNRFRACGGVVSLSWSFFSPPALFPPRLDTCSCQFGLCREQLFCL